MNRFVASAFFCTILQAAVPSGGGGASAQEAVGALGLGDECNRDRDCEASIVLGRCELGYCACLPFHAAYNRTHCLESKLLGQECTVGEQCALRVANSSCNEGLCKCQEGFLQYHSHTCLRPARLGDVCYSHAHCKLWDSDTHCDFLIPDLFGRCKCTAPMRQDGEVCRPDRLVQLGNRTIDDQLASVETHRPIEFTTKPPEEEDPGVQLSWLRNATMLLSTVPPTQLMPFNLVTRPSLRAELQPNELPQDDAVVVEAELTELVETTTASTADEAAAVAAAPLKTDRHESSAFSPVSLGQACAWDAECQLADPHSRCLGGLCDCPRRANGSSPGGCGARRTGCAPGSFQCRGTGACISWFFVCDGRHDCGDGSDEQCSLGDGQTRCPAQAFRCKSSATCVSRAALCDGTRDCPNGEDEAGCSDRRSCPEGAFRCNNGQCLPAYEFCNAVVSCRDGSDEPRGACRTRNRSRLAPRHCPFRCANGRCRSDAITCSGKDGCGDNSDELHCSVCRCPPL